MSDPSSETSAASTDQVSQPGRPVGAVVPASGVGWLAVVLAVAGIASLLAAMVMAGVANDPSAVDGGIMIASILIVIVGALTNVLAVWLWRQRSVLNLLALVASVAVLGLLLMLGLGGFFNGVF